jgi:uncharacterized protein
MRGFALSAILIANLPVINTQVVHGSIDYYSDMLFQILIDKKFITIFSILFGFGFYKQMESAEAKAVNFRKYFFIRMVLLFLIGALHGYLLWFGDILKAFAIGGIFLLLLYKSPIKKLIYLAITFNIILTGIVFIGNGALGWQEYNYDYSLPEKLPLVSSYLEYLKITFTINPWTNFLQDLPVTLFFTFGNMIIGFILAKINFFSSPKKKLLNIFIFSGTILGLLASITFYFIQTGKIELSIPLLWVPFLLSAGMVLQSLCYISLFLLLFNTKVGKTVLSVFVPVGKLALTNYLLQSVFYVLVFYHFAGGLQLFGKLSLTETYLFGILLFAAQVSISSFWLRFFNQGPVEFVWKYFAYKYYRK